MPPACRGCGIRARDLHKAVWGAEVGGRARGPQVAGVPTCRGRPKTAGRSAGPDVSAPLAPALPLRTRRQSRSALLGSARSARLCSCAGSPRSGWARPAAPRAWPGRTAHRRGRSMGRAQALVLALTFQLCAPETETPAGTRCARSDPACLAPPSPARGPWRLPGKEKKVRPSGPRLSESAPGLCDCWMCHRGAAACLRICCVPVS